MLFKVLKSIEGAPIASSAGSSAGGVAPWIKEYSWVSDTNFSWPAAEVR